MRDQPLRAEVLDGRLVISIGVETLAFADNERQKELAFHKAGGHEAPPDIRIVDPDVWAKEVANALQSEREDGWTPLSGLLDDAAERALDAGSLAVEYRCDVHPKSKENGAQT